MPVESNLFTVASDLLLDMFATDTNVTEVQISVILALKNDANSSHLGQLIYCLRCWVKKSVTGRSVL